MKISNILSRRNRILLAELVRTDFKLRYQASALGYVWSVLNPLLLFTILYFVFDVFLGIGKGIEHYPVYLLLGVVLWRFFMEATGNGLKAIVQRGSLIRKINFPRYIIVISGTISSLINLGINLVVVLLFVFFNGVELSWSAFMLFPLIIELYALALAVAFFLAAVNVRFRDISNIWDIIMQAAFYATPIIYPVSVVVEKTKSEVLGQILLLNPVAQIIQDVRYFVVTPDAVTLVSVFHSSLIMIVPIGTIGLIAVGASLYFKSQSKKFAEYV
jgi:ABC-2 type transport system permease protein